MAEEMLIRLTDAIVRDDAARLRELLTTSGSFRGETSSYTNHFYHVPRCGWVGVIVNDTLPARALAEALECSHFIYWGKNTDSVQEGSVSDIVKLMSDEYVWHMGKTVAAPKACHSLVDELASMPVYDSKVCGL